MSAARTLLVLLFVLASARLAEVPRQYASSQPGGGWDDRPAATLPAEDVAGLSGAENRAEDEASRGEAVVDEAPKPPAVIADAGRAERTPAREPAVPPRDAHGDAHGDARAPLAAETRRPAAIPTGEPTLAFDVASAEPAPEAAAPPAGPRPAEARTGTVAAHAEKVYYEIEGLSRAEISAALRAHGPDVRGQQFFGLTEWEMGVEYRAVEVESGCAIDGLKVRVSTETHLPRWPGDAVASSALSGAWDRFITALDHHEDGHRVLAEEAAETVRRRLLAVSAPTCGRLDGVAQREMAAVMQEYEARQLAYDAETDHGRTQGAVWPPARAEHLSASVGEE